MVARENRSSIDKVISEKLAFIMDHPPPSDRLRTNYRVVQLDVLVLKHLGRFALGYWTILFRPTLRGTHSSGL